jgi:hypothetical protein
MSRPTLSIRLSRPRDAAALARLARANSVAPPSGRALIAERHGVPVAAIGLTSGAVIADPARRGAETVRLLRRDRYRLVRQGGDVGRLSSRTTQAAGAAA